MAKVVSAREPGGLTIYHGQDALEEAHALGELLIKGRRQIGHMHRKLEATHRQIGLGPAAYGPGGKPYEPETMSLAAVSPATSGTLESSPHV